MEPVDAALAGFVGRHVLQPYRVVDRCARTAHGCNDQGARPQPARDVLADLGDAAEILVTDDEEVVTRRRRAEQGVDDLLVGPARPDADDIDEHPAAVGNVAHERSADLPEIE